MKAVVINSGGAERTRVQERIEASCRAAYCSPQQPPQSPSEVPTLPVDVVWRLNSEDLHDGSEMNAHRFQDEIKYREDLKQDMTCEKKGAAETLTRNDRCQNANLNAQRCSWRKQCEEPTYESLNAAAMLDLVQKGVWWAWKWYKVITLSPWPGYNINEVSILKVM